MPRGSSFPLSQGTRKSNATDYESNEGKKLFAAAVHACAVGDHNRLCELVTKRPALASMMTDEKNTLLHVAAAVGRIDMMLTLLLKGALIDVQDVMGFTPLMVALQFQRQECVEALLKQGASVTLCNAQQHTPLHIAAIFDATGVVGSLLRSGADINALDSEGRTPLLCAIPREHRHLALQLLLQPGVSLTEVDAHGNDALRLMHEFGFIDDTGRILHDPESIGGEEEASTGGAGSGNGTDTPAHVQVVAQTKGILKAPPQNSQAAFTSASASASQPSTSRSRRSCRSSDVDRGRSSGSIGSSQEQEGRDAQPSESELKEDHLPLEPTPTAPSSHTPREILDKASIRPKWVYEQRDARNGGFGGEEDSEDEHTAEGGDAFDEMHSCFDDHNTDISSVVSSLTANSLTSSIYSMKNHKRESREERAAALALLLAQKEGLCDRAVTSTDLLLQEAAAASNQERQHQMFTDRNPHKLDNSNSPQNGLWSSLRSSFVSFFGSEKGPEKKSPGLGSAPDGAHHANADVAPLQPPGEWVPVKSTHKQQSRLPIPMGEFNEGQRLARVNGVARRMNDGFNLGSATSEQVSTDSSLAAAVSKLLCTGGA